ncbi:nucleotidyltransferase family protein [Sabulilitoribacter arenilitoris]|uniref:Nucleotidyltransferase family protein n=1 Tax=Wocania arenilitoris TaxID=2044858 RepID=A0AAE3ER89_9FLAO|nr:nucleotidyltransferase family protein [Wocania arenilitoris]MCF7569412.1 nucleotidyltransferase family protein [Wocania arenilitoris]
MNKTSNISVVILAAGASKRMGTPKQLLKWGDSTLLSNAIETALKLQIKEVIVVLGANYNLIKKTIHHYPVTILNNKDWHNGLGKSLAFGVTHLMHSKQIVNGCLITLADQPFIKNNFLNTLIEEFNKNKYSILATSYKNKTSGVPVVFDKKYFNELVKLNSDKGAKEIINKYLSEVKNITPQLRNIDIDTLQDYEEHISKK